MKTEPLGWDAWYDSYLNYLRDVQKKAAGTVRDIRCTLKRVSGWMWEHDAGKPLWQLTLSTYLAWLEEERTAETSPRSLEKYLSHLRGLLDYSFRAGKSDRNVLDGFTLQDGKRPAKPRWLTMGEAKRLLQACPSETEVQRQERIIVLLLYGCGVRTQELSQVRLQDVDRQRQELFIQKGKGDRQRSIPIPSVVYTELLAYLLERGGKRGFLLRGAKGARLSSHYLCQVVSEAARRAGLPEGVTPKVLRHSYATHLMDQGVDLGIIASLMGHRSPQETGVYLHVLEQDAEKAVEQIREGGGA